MHARQKTQESEAATIHRLNKKLHLSEAVAVVLQVVEAVLALVAEEKEEERLTQINILST